MKLSKKLTTIVNKDFFETEDQFTKIMQELELKRLRKSISIKGATKNRI